MNVKEKIQILIDLIENWLSDPADNTQLTEWHKEVDEIIYTLDCSEVEETCLIRIVEMYDEQIRKGLKRTHSMLTVSTKEELDTLLARKQTEQRTPAWYAQMSTILSASELGHLFASPYERGKFVISKTKPPAPRYQPLAIPSDRMMAFDWGIRFEPVVKQIYEEKYGVTLKELGRMVHPVDPRCSASPDGLIYDCPKGERTGRLIEIKCPATREVDGKISKKYLWQMQMQLHVTNLQYCDFVEAVIVSKYNNTVHQEGPSHYYGYVAVIRYAEMKGDQEFYYVYSPINCDADWVPDIKEEEELIEITPWRLLQWSEQLVVRSEEWWTSLKPMMDTFWEDVEKAKQGLFVEPESSRTKKTKVEKCLIHFHKVDEDGKEINE